MIASSLSTRDLDAFAATMRSAHRFANKEVSAHGKRMAAAVASGVMTMGRHYAEFQINGVNGQPNVAIYLGVVDPLFCVSSKRGCLLLACSPFQPACRAVEL